MKKKRTNPYKEANEAFLAEKAQEEGIVALDNGVLYKVLEEGHGTKKPTPRSIVYVHYTGRLIDGTVFDTTEGDQLPALFMVGDSSWAGRLPLHACTKAINGKCTSPPSGATVP